MNKKSPRLFFTLVVLAMLPAAALAAPKGFRCQANIPLESDRQGTVIDVIGFSHEVVSPRDAASGLPTGKRQHKPYTITKRIDKSSPLLAKAMVGSTVFPAGVQIRCENLKASEGDVQLYSVELTNASIAGIKIVELTNRKVGDPIVAVEEVSLNYQKITWTWNDGSLESKVEDQFQ